ncbi:MAG: hypothetical protein AB7O82_35235, partial [Reyranella sp.]
MFDINLTIEEINQASIIPERWYTVLNHLVEISDAEGALLFGTKDGLLRWISSPEICHIVKEWISSGWVNRNSRDRLISKRESRFLTDLDGFTFEELATDPFYNEFLRPRGLGWCVGTVIQGPYGDSVVFSIEKAFEKGPVGQEAVNTLNDLRPHLERAAALSTIAGREHARAVVGLLQSVGVPAAVLSRSAQPLVDDRLTFSNVEAQAAFAGALTAINCSPCRDGGDPTIISGIRHDVDVVAQLIHFDKPARNVFSEA